MANKGLVDLFQQGAEVWNAWRREHPKEYFDLRDADFRGADLYDANLRGANFIDANLIDADLTGADLTGADLTGADLRGTYLCGACLRATDLTGADLRGANLRGADLNDARLFETIFGDTNLNKVSGLETCKHSGPSTIDFRTLAQSWPLPLAFLRGVGLPDTVIDYLPSLLNEPLQFYSCFISYSSNDQGFAERLHADLQNKGVRCWFAPHDIQGGKQLGKSNAVF